MERSSTSVRLDGHPLASSDVVADYVRKVPEPGGGGRMLLLPGGPRIYVLFGDAANSRLAIGRRTFAPLPAIGFVGTTTKVACLDHGDTILFGLRLRSTAWAMLFDGDVSQFTDRVVPLATIARTATPAVGDPAADAAAVFAPWLTAQVEAGPGYDRQARRIIDLIDARPHATIADIASSLRLTPQQLSAACLEKFGLMPKRLLILRRFLRVLRRLLADPTAAGRTLWEAGYVDHSHFAKDCRQFLGASLQTFRDRAEGCNDLL